VLQKLIEGRLTFEPREDATGRYYAFRGVGTVTKLLAGLVPQNVASPTGLETVCTFERERIIAAA
jgi:hypothetical protein